MLWKLEGTHWHHKVRSKVLIRPKYGSRQSNKERNMSQKGAFLLPSHIVQTTQETKCEYTDT